MLSALRLLVKGQHLWRILALKFSITQRGLPFLLCLLPLSVQACVRVELHYCRTDKWTTNTRNQSSNILLVDVHFIFTILNQLSVFFFLELTFSSEILCIKWFKMLFYQSSRHLPILILKTLFHENLVFCVFNMFLQHFSFQGGHTQKEA